MTAAPHMSLSSRSGCRRASFQLSCRQDNSMTNSTKTRTRQQSPDREPAASLPQRFDWPLAYEAEKLLRERIGAFLEHNTFARQLADRMRQETGTDFFEWIDHLVLSPDEEDALRESGFVRD